MSYRTGPKIVTDGLVLCLDAADRNSYPGTGSTWGDLSGNENNGTFGASTAAPTFINDNGGCLDFDGSNDFVDNNSAINALSGDFSIELCYKSQINTGGYRILFETNGYRVDSGNGLAIYQYNDHFRIWGKPTVGGTNIQMITTSDGSIGLNNWKHLILSRISNILTLYINTVSSGSYTGNTANYDSINPTNKYNIGGGRTIYFFNGNISTVKVYNRALTASEIQQNYNATKGRFGL